MRPGLSPALPPYLETEGAAAPERPLADLSAFLPPYLETEGAAAPERPLADLSAFLPPHLVNDPFLRHPPHPPAAPALRVGMRARQRAALNRRLLLNGEGLLDPKDTTRIHRGLAPEVERIRFPEIFGAFDPAELRNDETPPIGTLSELEDVFGDDVRLPASPDGRPRVILRMHPWFRRWALFEHAAGTDGAGPQWHCFWVCGVGEGKDGHLPADLHTSDGRYNELGYGDAAMGPFRVPHKQDFVLVKRLADKRNGHKSQLAAAMEKNRAKHKDAKHFWQDKTRDLLDYAWWAVMSEANQRAGSGQRPYSTFSDHASAAGVDRHQDRARYDRRTVEIEGKPAYTVIEKRSA